MPSTSEPTVALAAFCKTLDERKDLQEKVKACETPQEIIDIAASIGLEVSYEVLRIWSRDLSANYFPWAAKGHEWRRNFFMQKG